MVTTPNSTGLNFGFEIFKNRTLRDNSSKQWYVNILTLLYFPKMNKCSFYNNEKM